MIRTQLIPAKDRARIDRLGSKAYRDAYLEAQVHSWISHQFRALRMSMGLTQKRMAEKIGKPQSVISRLENDEYGKVSLQTLLDVAQAIDVALLVQFVSYPDLLERTRDKSPDGMVPENIAESTARMNRAAATEELLQSSGQKRQISQADFGRSPGLQNHLVYSASNRDKKFNGTDSALLQTGTVDKQISRRIIQ